MPDTKDKPFASVKLKEKAMPPSATERSQLHRERKSQGLSVARLVIPENMAGKFEQLAEDACKKHFAVDANKSKEIQ